MDAQRGEQNLSFLETKLRDIRKQKKKFFGPLLHGLIPDNIQPSFKFLQDALQNRMYVLGKYTTSLRLKQIAVYIAKHCTG